MEKTLTRSLVYRSEDAGHPFRRMLAPATLKIEVAEENKEPKSEKWWKQEDTHLFLMSFTAFFVCFYTFIV